MNDWLSHMSTKCAVSNETRSAHKSREKEEKRCHRNWWWHFLNWIFSTFKFSLFKTTFFFYVNQNILKVFNNNNKNIFFLKNFCILWSKLTERCICIKFEYSVLKSRKMVKFLTQALHSKIQWMKIPNCCLIRWYLINT